MSLDDMLRESRNKPEEQQMSSPQDGSRRRMRDVFRVCRKDKRGSGTN